MIVRSGRLRSFQIDAAAIPFPSQDTTHHVTKMNFIGENLPNKKSTQWAIKCGRQPNRAYIIGIDFDIYGQNQGKVVKHEQTESLFNDFLEFFGSKGVWESGTEGNFGYWT